MDLDMEQKKINYTIVFLTDWHAGSGLSAGAEADAVVIKDNDSFPYIPGKTMKGLFVDAFKDFMSLEIEGFNQINFNRLFGNMDDITKVTSPGSLFFSNVSLPLVEKSAIGQDKVDFLYRNFASTAINAQNGVAKNTSLRVIEVCIPLSMDGYIQDLTDEDKPLINQLAKYIRSIGSNRNRGLGRCTINLK